MTLDEGRVAQLEPGAIALGQRHRLRHPIHPGHSPGRTLAGQGQGDGTGASAQIQYRGGRRR